MVKGGNGRIIQLYPLPWQGKIRQPPVYPLPIMHQGDAFIYSVGVQWQAGAAEQGGEVSMAAEDEGNGRAPGQPSFAFPPPQPLGFV